MISIAQDGLYGASASADDQSCLVMIGTLGILGGAMPIFLELQDAVPPADRFIGKSPAYVDAYQSTYARSVRMRKAPILLLGYPIGGCLIPYLVAQSNFSF